MTPIAEARLVSLREAARRTAAEWATLTEAHTRACAALSDLRHYGPEVAPQISLPAMTQAFQDAHARALVLGAVASIALLETGDHKAAADAHATIGALATSEELDAGGLRAALALSRLVGPLRHYLAALAIETAAGRRGEAQ